MHAQRFPFVFISYNDQTRFIRPVSCLLQFRWCRQESSRNTQGFETSGEDASRDAQMQQKARLASLESFNNSNSRSVVVATDVAARGLDIPSVASIVQYDVARSIDTFVHRAGRTARVIGENAIGWSVSLVLVIMLNTLKRHQWIVACSRMRKSV